MYSQKYSHYNAKFSLIEKSTLSDTSSLIHGDVAYNLSNNETLYTIKFPEKKKWHFVDSTLTISSDTSVLRKKEFAEINQLTIFKNILTNNIQDFDLAENGFEMQSMNKDNGTIRVTWLPPPTASTFLEHVITESKDNLLQAVAFIDIDGKAINRTYYQDYISIKNVMVPLKIKSIFKAKTEEKYRILSFTDVEIY